MNDILGNLSEHEYPMVDSAWKLRSPVNVIEASVGEFAAKEELARMPDLLEVCKVDTGQAMQ